jgi:hypothetical protein
MSHITKEIIDSTLSQARVYLSELGEFAPFGSGLNRNNKIVPLGAFFHSDNPSSLEMIEMLQQHIIEKLSSKDFSIAAIAIDIVIRKEKEILMRLK